MHKYINCDIYVIKHFSQTILHLHCSIQKYNLNLKIIY